MQFVGFFLDPITLSIDTYNGDNVTELQPPIVLNSNAKDSLLLKIYKLQYVSGNSDKFGTHKLYWTKETECWSLPVFYSFPFTNSDDYMVS